MKTITKLTSKVFHNTTIIIFFILIASRCQLVQTNQRRDSVKTLSTSNKLDTSDERFGSKNSCDLDVAEVYVYPPAASPNIVSQECSCESHTSNCNVYIRWEDGPLSLSSHRSSISSYLISFWLREKDDDTKVCHRLPPHQKFYNFNRSKEFPEPQKELIVHFPFTVSALPIYLPTFEATRHVIVCPTRIKLLQPLQHNSEVCEGETHIFNCSYDAYPMPDSNNIIWTFTYLDGRNEAVFEGGNGVSLHDDNNIEVTKYPGTTTLRILRTRTDHQGSYTCNINSHVGNYYSAKSQGSLRVRQNSTSYCWQPQVENTEQVIHICLASALVILLVVICLTLYLRKPLSRSVQRCNPSTPSHIRRQRSVYISHCSPTTKQRDKVLKLAYILESNLPDVSVLMDVTKTTEINKVGGLAQWIPQQMSNADKIIIILSKNYLDALDVETTNVKYNSMTSHVVKVAAEYRFILKMLHESCNSSNKLIICYEQRGPEDYPALFRGKVCYLVPNVTKETVAKDNDFISILSAAEPSLNCVQLRELCQ